MAWDRPRPAVPQFPRLEIRVLDTPALCWADFWTGLCLDFLAPADPSAWDGGSYIDFPAKASLLQGACGFAAEMDRREMLFLILGSEDWDCGRIRGCSGSQPGPSAHFPAKAGFFQPLESSGCVRSDFIYLSCPKQSLGIGRSCCFCWNLSKIQVWCWHLVIPVSFPLSCSQEGAGAASASRDQLWSVKHLQQQPGQAGAPLSCPSQRIFPVHISRGAGSQG